MKKNKTLDMHLELVSYIAAVEVNLLSAAEIIHNNFPKSSPQLTKPTQTMLHIQIASLLEKRNDTVKLERLAQSGVIQLTPMAEVDLKDLMWKPMPVYKLINL